VKLGRRCVVKLFDSISDEMLVLTVKNGHIAGGPESLLSLGL
jgi:hypothetical protein